MSSSPQDSATQQAASAATLANQQTQQANAAAAEQTSKNQTSTLFGTYNPATNQYSGGTESANLSPTSIDANGLSGSYASLYGTQADQQAQAAKNAVVTSQQNAASRGMGATPTGYTADQQRQAYQTQAAANSSNYANDFGNQNQQQVSLYNNANSMLANNENQNQASATSNLGDAGSTGTSLYNTASQQVQNPLMTLATAGLGAAGTAAGGLLSKGCWIAAEIFGGWTEPRTVLVREWLNEEVPKTRLGRFIVGMYMRFGERIAARIRVSNPLRAFFTPLFEEALCRATEWKAA
jgi:hypothetical protein